MKTRDYLRLFAEYNHWMNGRLYECCASLTDEERRRDMGAFFGSIHRTLEHIYWADRAWSIRWKLREGEIGKIGEPLFDDFGELRAEREALDQQLLTFAATVDEATFDAPFTMRSVLYGGERTLPLWVFAVHVFNHQTHHRGQVTTLLKQLGKDPGITDMPWMPALVDTPFFG